MSAEPEPYQDKDQPDVDVMALRQTARDWLSKFESCVRHRDYESAKKLFHRKAIYCGLYLDFADDLEKIQSFEWLLSWPNQTVFTIDHATSSIIPEGHLILTAARWTCRGLIFGTPEKTGRLTVALMTFSNRKTLAVHLHISATPC